MGFTLIRCNHVCVACEANSGPFVAADVFGFAVAQEQLVEGFQHFFGPHPGPDFHGQRLARVFIQDRQHLVAASIAELVVNEVDAPDVVRVGRAKPDDRAVLVIEPSAFLVPLRKLQPFLAPETLHLLVVHVPALDAQQLGDHALAVSAVLLGKSDERQSQGIVVLRDGPVLH
jgi:hypothetical protein